MPLRLEIKKKLTSRSERVKCVDLHPTQPLVLAALYSGQLTIWNYESQTLIKSFEATTQPIRCAKFISRKQWVVCGADDMMIRVYNYNTLEKVTEFEAHVDYIRSLEVHPSLPYILSGSDDMQIKLWDWEKFSDSMTGQAFDGHAHYIMCLKFNPRDTNTFASASLDRTIKLWSIGSPIPNYSLEGHEQGVNAVDFFPGGEKPYLVSGADDFTVKVWDYQTKTCIHTLTGHNANVSAVVFHPNLPLIMTGSEDGTLRLWHSGTYRLETTLNYALERVWCLAASAQASRVAAGFDEGTIVLQLGSDEVLASLEGVNGRAVIVCSNEVSMVNVRKASSTTLQDGEILNLDRKEMGNCEIYPQSVLHNANGRFVALVGDGEFIIYTAQALRNKAFGQCLDLAWSGEAAGDYALLKTVSSVQIVRNFDESKGFQKSLGFSVERLQGGPLLGLIFKSGEFIILMDWETGAVVRKINVHCNKIVWNNSGSLFALIGADEVFILSCNFELLGSKLNEVANVDEDSSEYFDDCFELVSEISEAIDGGVWVGDCFLYVNKQGTKLNYHVGGEDITLANLDKKMFLLNFVAKENRVYLIDKQQQIISYELLESVLQYQTAVVRKDFDLANEILSEVPQTKLDELARFLESQNYKEVALGLAQDLDLKFSLAISLNKLQTAFDIMNEKIATQDSDSAFDEIELRSKWRQLCDLALNEGEIVIAEECAKLGKDYSSLFLIYSSLNDTQRLQQLVHEAAASGDMNIAFNAAFALGNATKCVDVLSSSSRYAEASFFSRFYNPGSFKSTVQSWKDYIQVERGNSVLAASISDSTNLEAFPEMELLTEPDKDKFTGDKPISDEVTKQSSHVISENTSDTIAATEVIQENVLESEASMKDVESMSGSSVISPIGDVGGVVSEISGDEENDSVSDDLLGLNG